MWADKLTLACLMAANLLPSGPADAPRDAALPEISNVHRVFLSRVARRTVRDATLGRAPYDLDYVPAALADMDAEVVVRLRYRGYLLADAAAGPAPVTLATRDASLAAAQTLTGASPTEPVAYDNLLIEIEVVGPPQQIPVRGDWTRPRALDSLIEPGVHGLVLIGANLRHRFCPSELYTNDLVLADALKRLAQASHHTPAALGNVDVMRFRTVHWYEPSPGGGTVSLHRGLTIVPPEAVSPGGLDHAIAQLAQYMAYRQQESGLFAYQYEPGQDRYNTEQNLVRQVGAVVAMAVHAKWSGDSASRAAADLGIRFHLQGLTSIPDAEDAAFIRTADDRNKLGVTALLCLAMAEHPDAERYADVREKLINGMLWLQRPAGVFLTAFPPALEIDAQDYFPGEALLALASDYSHRPTARVLEAFHRAIDFYRDYFHNTRSPAFVPWQVQAYALMAQYGKWQDYVNYVYELTDWLADKQLTSKNCPWPELRGGIAAYSDNRAGVATAAYLEGFADALALAREFKDTERASTYEKVVRRAARFVMQLQMRPEEAYFVRSPQDAVWGIRTSPSLNLLRIDHCQHALIGLIKARDVLFPDVE